MRLNLFSIKHVSDRWLPFYKESLTEAKLMIRGIYQFTENSEKIIAGAVPWMMNGSFAFARHVSACL